MPRPRKSSYNNEKPPLSYVALCAMAIRSSSAGMMSLNEIYRFIINTFPYYKSTASKWRNSLRHNLSFNDCFVKIIQGGENGHKRSLWSLHPNCGDMFDEGSLLRRKRRFVAKRKHKDEAQWRLAKIGTPTESTTFLSSVHRDQTDHPRICDIIRQGISHNDRVPERPILGGEKEMRHLSKIGLNSTNFTIDNILKGSISKQKRQFERQEELAIPSLLSLQGKRHHNEWLCGVTKRREAYECQERRLHVHHSCPCKNFIELETKKQLFDAALYQFHNPNGFHFKEKTSLQGIEPQKASLTLHYKACCS